MVAIFFKKRVGIPMGTNCVSLLSDLHPFCEKKRNKLKSFTFCFRFIDDVLTLNDAQLDTFLDRICPNEFAILDA